MFISIEDPFLLVVVIVDDWDERKGKQLLGRTVGQKPEFSDSEMLTLMLAIDFFEFISERRYRAIIQANYLALFPKVLDQSQFNRRARSLRYLLNELRKDWAAELGVQCEQHFLLDTTPVIAGGDRVTRAAVTFAGQPPTATVRRAGWISPGDLCWRLHRDGGVRRHSGFGVSSQRYRGRSD